VLDWEGLTLVPTIHPSAILRMEADERDAALDAFVADLEVAAAQHV
jgi:DNA polymerase